MTNYSLKPMILPSLASQEAKAARQKQLAEVRKRRAQIAKARQEKAQTASHTNEDYQEYQDHLREEARL